jgi:hypothetical protein
MASSVMVPPGGLVDDLDQRIDRVELSLDDESVRRVRPGQLLHRPADDRLDGGAGVIVGFHDAGYR